MRLLYALVGLFCAAFGLALVEFAINSVASNGWSAPPSCFVQVIPALGFVLFLAGVFLILSASFLERMSHRVRSFA